MNPKIVPSSPAGRRALRDLHLSRADILRVLRRGMRRYRKHVQVFGRDHLRHAQSLSDLDWEFRGAGRGKQWNDHEILDFLERMQYALHDDARMPWTGTHTAEDRRTNTDLSLTYADLHVLSHVIDRDLP